MGHKDEYQLYFASERDAEEYLETHTEEGTYTIDREWVNNREFFFNYNQTIETNVRNSLIKKYECEHKAQQEAGQGASNVKTVEVVKEVEPKLWWVEVGNGVPVVCRNWAEVQEMLSRTKEETFELTISVKPISVAELVMQFNALSEE